MADFTGGPGFGAFVATFAVVAVSILLFRSLSKHLRKVRTKPEPTEATPAPSPGELTADSAAEASAAETSSDREDGDGDGDVVADETGDR